MPRYAEIIGDPIAHSMSPALHRFWLGALGLNAGYRARRVRRDELGSYFAERRRDPEWRGCNLTAPLKQAATSHASTLSCGAFQTGAINCVERGKSGDLNGYNSDRYGIAEALPGPAIEGKRIVLLGAGGAARSALYHLIKNKAAEIRVLARDPDKANANLSPLETPVPISVDKLDDVARLAGADGLINASPIGMAHASCPTALAHAIASLSPRGFVFDMVYAPLETPLLQAARRAKLEPIDGLTMLIGQADLAFRLFFEEAPPRRLDRELRRHLTAGR